MQAALASVPAESRLDFFHAPLRFCSFCTRLRTDASGRLHRCLTDPVVLDLLELLDRYGDPGDKL
jgi:molybdenum cofactor biosynthesis enzyme MoaA